MTVLPRKQTPLPHRPPRRRGMGVVYHLGQVSWNTVGGNGLTVQRSVPRVAMPRAHHCPPFRPPHSGLYWRGPQATYRVDNAFVKLQLQNCCIDLVVAFEVKLYHVRKIEIWNWYSARSWRPPEPSLLDNPLDAFLLSIICLHQQKWKHRAAVDDKYNIARVYIA